VKKKKNKTRFKDFDKKPESDLMDAYRETPAKQEVKEEVSVDLFDYCRAQDNSRSMAGPDDCSNSF